MISLVIPGTPPSVNHYKGYNRRTRRWYVKPGATSFKASVAAVAAGRQLPKAKGYEVDIMVFLGKGQKGDSDNFNKVVLDALVAARVIPGDAGRNRITVDKGRDWANPRTEITVRVREGA
jgi:Holliday junction resolvase RusA-like endonuclease